MDKRSLAAIAILAALAGAGMYFINVAHQREMASLEQQLAAAKQQTASMEAAVERFEEARHSLEKARQAAEEAKRRADIALQKALAAERARAELEAKKAADAAKALQERMASERAARERLPGPAVSGQSLHEQALALEQEGKGYEAVRLHIRAARSGYGKAALRLGEIYDKGISGIARDYAESLKWYNAARVLGEDVPMARSR